MNNSELGSRTQGWADVTFPFFLLGDDFGGPARLGTVCWGLLGDFKSSSLAEDHQCRFKGNNPPYLLITLKAFAMEIWAPEAGRMWLKAWLSRRWLCFQTSFMLQGKKRLLVLTSVSHSHSFDIWMPLFPVAVLLLYAEPAFCARSSLKDCFHKVDIRKWSRTRKIYQ